MFGLSMSLAVRVHRMSDFNSNRFIANNPRYTNAVSAGELYGRGDII